MEASMDAVEASAPQSPWKILRKLPLKASLDVSMEFSVKTSMEAASTVASV